MKWTHEAPRQEDVTLDMWADYLAKGDDYKIELKANHE